MDPVGKAVAYHFMQSFIVQWVQRIHRESYISLPFTHLLKKWLIFFSTTPTRLTREEKNNLKKHTNSVCFRPLNLFHKQILITTLHFQPKTQQFMVTSFGATPRDRKPFTSLKGPTCSCSICMVSCQVWGETMRQPRYLIDSDVVSVHHREVGHI